MRARPSLSLIFLGRPLLRQTLSTCERWFLLLSHIRATDDLEMLHFRAISRNDSPVFSLRNQTLVYTITNCETVSFSNRLTVNLVYSLKYCTRDYATKQVFGYDEFQIVVFRLQRKVRYKTPEIVQTYTSYNNSLKKPQKTHFPCSKKVETTFFA